MARQQELLNDLELIDLTAYRLAYWRPNLVPVDYDEYIVDYMVDSTDDDGIMHCIALVTFLDNITGFQLLGLEKGSVQDVDDVASLLSKCRLLEFYCGTQFPETYIKKLEIDSTERKCILTDKNYVKKRYRTDDVKSFEKQIRLGRPQVPPTS